MNKFTLIIATLFLLTSKVYSQYDDEDETVYNKMYIEVLFGKSTLDKGKILNQSFDEALSFGVKFNYELPWRSISVSPIIEYKKFKSEDNSYLKYDYNINFLKSGVQVNYLIFEILKRRLQFFCFGEMGYTWQNFNSIFDNDENKDEYKVATGNSPYYSYGLRLKYRYLFVEYSVLHNKTKYKFTDDIKKAYSKAGISLSDNDTKYKLDTQNIMLGISIPLN